MIASIVTLVLVAMSGVGPATSPVTVPVIDGMGGPDDYGYIYVDSDTACGIAPTYEWIDIKAIGMQVENLGDDNVVGPYNIGFDFPYYWYSVSQFYIGSNGYIAFHDNALDASPFQHMPATENPNNLIAPMLSDLNPEAGGSVWVWNNSDTCIIQFDSLQFWNTGGNNTFEIIISKADSSIRFQYKEQSGQPYNGWAPDNNQTGIENVSGAIGLSYLSGTIPPGNMYHADLAVQFIPPESTSMEIHDAGIRNAMNDRNGGMFQLNGQPLAFWAIAKNFGNQNESDFTSYVKVKRSSGSVVHYDSVSTSVQNPGDLDSIVFANTWTPATNGTYVIYIYTVMSGDVFPPNDTAKVELHVLNLPGTLTYDKGVADAYYSWNGPGGYGARFVPPVYPCSITSVRMMAQSANGVNCAFGVFDDNGPGGSPGDTLAITNVNVSSPQWYVFNLVSALRIDDGAFFLGAMSSTSSDPSFGMDTMPPTSGQSWEYTGVWAPSRDLWVREAMFNAMISATGISEWIEPAPAPAPTRIDVNPNPFGTSARLNLINGRGTETTVEVFDATGSVVRTLDVVRGTTVFDGRDQAGRLLADGIYFARVRNNDSSVAKVVISR